MNIKLYRQKKKIPAFGSGKKIYQGEDSHPYADSDVLIVADGLGGRGGFPHTKIDARILEREELYGIMFSSVFTAEVSDEFKDFVTDNFVELFETKEYYFDGDDTTRRSGYFASRIVTAIALYEIKYNPIFAKENVFNGFSEMTEEQKDTLALDLGEKLAALILEKLTAIAELVGFEMEVSNKGAYLLPSTLTVALMNENEASVDVLYLWAGDSRGYIWNVSDGMAQVTEDHERDETMTNLVTLSRPFTVEGRFLSVKKPCAIFNATDGIYKPPSFICPIDQEYIMLLAIDMFDDEAAAMDFLEKQYNMLSPDDSSTLALYGCGYESFADFKLAVKERLAVIKESYVDKLGGIFERDYLGELDAIMRDIPKAFADGAVAEQILSVPEIEKIVVSDMIERKYPPYVASLAGDDGDTEAGIEKQRAARAALVAYVKDNWIKGARFKGIVPAAIRDFIDGESVYEIEDGLREAGNAIVADHYAVGLEKNREVVSVINSVAKKMRSFDLALGDGGDAAIKEVEEACYAYISFLREIREGEEKNTRLYLENKRTRWELYESYLEHDKDAIDGFINLLLGVESFDALPENYRKSLSSCESRRRVADLHAEYVASSRELSMASTEGPDRKAEFAAQYWCENKRLHGLVWNQYRSLIPETVIDGILSQTPGAVEKRAELTSALSVREELYGNYNKLYYRSYRPTKI